MCIGDKVRTYALRMPARFLIMLLPCSAFGTEPCGPGPGGLAPACGGKVSAAAYSGLKGKLKVVHVTEHKIDGEFDRQRRFGNRWRVPTERDLAARVIRLAETNFATPDHGPERCWASSFGDLIGEFCKHRGDDAATARVWETLRSEHRKLYDEVHPILPHLLNDARFVRDGPGNKSDQPDDGFYFAEPVEIDSRRYSQGVTLLFRCGSERDACAAIDKVKKVERSMGLYKDWKGLKYPYAWVKLVDDTVYRTPDDRVAVSVFQYKVGGYFGLAPKFKFAFLEEFAGGYLRTVYYFSSGGYFKWAWGADTYVPIHDSKGEFVCLAIVTAMTTKPADPESMTIGNVGNLKYWAERVK
ncbi:MAG: hypothetical protein PVI86_15915 [Phycisphaerae bacterium]|jgi:hypothetical protein